jgi:hypothetical protein
VKNVMENAVEKNSAPRVIFFKVSRVTFFHRVFHHVFHQVKTHGFSHRFPRRFPQGFPQRFPQRFPPRFPQPFPQPFPPCRFPTTFSIVFPITFSARFPAMCSARFPAALSNSCSFSLSEFPLPTVRLHDGLFCIVRHSCESMRAHPGGPSWLGDHAP